jgi:UDP-3-O-[3-hydroxymyristoyl] glucosamine N-acyltransferase
VLKFKANSLHANEIAEYLNTEHIGENILITTPAPLRLSREGAICYYEGENLPELRSVNTKFAMITTAANIDSSRKGITFLPSKNPKADFYRAISEFYTQDSPHILEPTAFIGREVKLGNNVHVGRNSVIDGTISVGYNSYIGNNVNIKGNVEIGSGCVVKDGVVIGGEGFEFVPDENGALHIPKFGHVSIGENVWIGASTTIERPTFGATTIENDVKIDDLVHIGESSRIGTSTQIAAGAVITNEVEVGMMCLVGVNVSIRPFVTIGDRITLGMGSVVVKNIIDENAVYAGVPAKKLR